MAMAVRSRHTSLSAMEDHMERNMKDFLNSLFGPLIKIGDNNSINLLHQSVKDFLISENLAEKDNPLNLNTFHDANSPYFHINPREANFQLALTCLRYLSLDEFGKGPITDIFDHLGELKHVLRQYPFLSYAASYWCDHAQYTSHENCERGTLWHAFWMVAKSSTKINPSTYELGIYPRDDKHMLSPPLQIAASFGGELFVDGLLDTGADVNACDGPYSSALIAAAYNGHLDVVHLLVDRGADVNIRGVYLIGSALQAAILSGYKEMIQLLVNLGGDVNAQGGLYGNALMAAAYFGDFEAVRLFVERGADVNTQISDCGNALCAAVVEGNQEAFQLLVSLGADIHLLNGYYGSVLHAAAKSGNLEMFQQLLDLGAKIDINSRGGHLGNIIQAAAYGGNRDIVLRLVGLGAHVNTESNRY